MIESLSESKLRLRTLIDSGVIIDDERTCYISECSSISVGAHIEPNVTIKGASVVGAGALIGANCVLDNAAIGSNCVVRASYIEDSFVGDGTTVGPFAYIRNSTKIGANCRIGDFVEVKNSIIADKVKASHLAYIGDASVGEGTNVGCGTVFANYNGKIKQRTSVGKNVFIGANTNLIASVDIGDWAYIAAGSTVTQNVPSGALCIARERQIIKHDWIDIRRQ